MKRRYPDKYSWVDEVVRKANGTPEPTAPVSRKLYKKARKRLKMRVRTIPTKGERAPDKYREFLASPEWKQMRYTILLRDKGTCQACGSTRASGAILNIDHIQPLHKNWERRLDPDNLQVLCSSCNCGKGSWDATDWRDKADPLTQAYRATLAED